MLPSFSVKRPYTIVVAVIIVLILGTISFLNLQTDLLPSIDLPYVVISTTYPGASPEEVEMIVTRPLEQVLATTSNIKNVSSISMENSSIVVLEYNNDTNMDSATIEINSMLDLVKPAWDDSISAPMVVRLNPDMLPVMTSSVDVEGMDIIEISHLIEERIIPEFESISGVASVSGQGLLREHVEVSINSEKIEELNRKMLKEIDKELAEAEEQLLEAREEIEEGRAKLASQEESQFKRLAEGEKAIEDAKKEMADGESKILLGELELRNAKGELQSKLNEITVKEQELLGIKTILDSIKENIIDKTRDELESNKAKLEGELDELLARLPDDQREEFQRALEEIEGNLFKGEKQKVAGYLEEFTALEDEINDGLQIISQGKDEIQKGLEEISSKERELIEQKSFLRTQKNELSKKEGEILEGKLLLSRELDKAGEKLQQGEETLEEKLEEFEKARDEAFKKANLDGVLTQEMISGILTAQNFAMPAGYVTEEGTDYLIKVGDKVDDLDEIKNLLLFDTGEDAIGKIYLKDVADIAFKDNSEGIYAKVNGNDAVMLVFQKQSTFSTADVAKRIRDKSEELSEEHEGLTVTHLMDQGIYIDMVVESVIKNVIYGGILAILVLILFLRDIKPTIIIAVSIPISIIFAVAMMYFTGITINIISLSGLALGVGMLVDNSIVVIENIYRLRQEGMSARDAAIEGAREVSGAIFASTLTTACVFLPIVFVQGMSRQLFTDMGFTIAYSLFASLLVALTLVSTMGANMLKKVDEKEEPLFDKIKEIYEKLLRVSLRHKAIVMILVVILLGASVYGGLSMGTSFIPDMEAPQMDVTIEMPKEATFIETTSMSDEVMDRIMDIGGVDTIGAFQGGIMGGLGANNSMGNSMSLYLLLDENKTISNDEIGRQIENVTADLDCTININTSTMDLSSLGSSGMEVLIKGRDMDTLRGLSSDVAKLLEQIDGTINVSDGVEDNLTEVRIIIDKEKAMEKGLTVAQVFSHINSILSKDRSATTLSIQNKDYPVIILDEKNKSITRDDIGKLEIETSLEHMDSQEGETIKIEDISEIIETEGLSSIRRDSQERYMTVTAGIDADHNIGLVSREFERKLRDFEIPDGYKVEIAGESELIDESMLDLSKMLLLAIVFIYLIMVAQFQSLLSPFIVMFTIPLAFTGGLAALVFTGNEISLIAMLGFLVLGGVVVNNGIVFVDFANQLRADGLNTIEALILAGKTRLKPILMTAITTILGLSTTSIGVGMGAEMIQPLAIVIIGGLTYATILTLIVIPVMYLAFHKDKPASEGVK
ncbi:MAG: MMPL family transporter [Clostridiales bacterium]|nr:MMPL family transporter [Clostridiales bacterium]